MATIKIPAFTKGMSFKNGYLGDPTFIRMGQLKFSDKPGVLISRGGWDDWDTGIDLSYNLGMKRWYREDGGTNIFYMATDSGGSSQIRLRSYNLNDKASVTKATLSGNYDYEAPVLWVDCGSQLIVLPLTYSERPWTAKLQGYANGSDGGVEFRRLGLDSPVVTGALVIIIGYITNGTNQQVMNGLDDGVYKYRFTQSYGTLDQPQKYGESGFSDITLTINLTGTLNKNGIIHFGDLSVPPFSGFIPVGDSSIPIVTRINIYRTLKNANTYYKVGEITERGRVDFNDTLNDSLVDLSKTGPIYSGIATGIRCALWHPTLQRLFWFGMDGFLHHSAASYPDINPTNQKTAVGNTGYFGNGIFLIRDVIYGFKEDGIYVIGGEAPAYISKKVSSVQCFARASFAEMPDGIYFLGVEAGKTRFYKFNGNSATPISEDINSLLPANKSYLFKKIFAKRVGDEYWVSLMSRDWRYAQFEGLPYNNLVLAYDIRYNAWTHFPAQASCFEVFDGPGDSGEIYLMESDPIGNSTVGNFFRFNPNAWKVSGTTYTAAGSRLYSKTTTPDAILTLGPIKGLNRETRDKVGNLEFTNALRLKTRFKWRYNKGPTGVLHDDSEMLQKNIASAASLPIEPLEKYSNLTLTGDAAPVWGVGKFGTALLELAPYEEALMNITQPVRDLGFALDIVFADSSAGNDILEIEALELDYQSSER